MSEQKIVGADLMPEAGKIKMPTAYVWQTATDLAGTDKERKQYFIHVQDGEKAIRFSLHVHADGLLRVESFAVHEIDYWDYDGWDDPDEIDEDDEEYWYLDGDEDEDDSPEEENETEEV